MRALDTSDGCRTCTGCEIRKPLAEFSKSNKDRSGTRSRCKPCVSAKMRGRNDRRRERYATDPEYRRHILSTVRKRSYGLTQERFEEMLAEQGGACAVCRTTEPHSVRGWAVDHDHRCCSGKVTCGKCVRGLLCHKCNLGIGQLADDPVRLERAATYLRRYQK